LADDAAVESVALSDSNLLDRFGGSGIHVSMSTIAPETARDLAEHRAKKGVAYLASPVIGRPDRAATGTLFLLLAGEGNAKQKVQPLLKVLGQRIFDFGEKPWIANTAKLIVNFNIVAAIESMAEAFTLAEKNGIPGPKWPSCFQKPSFRVLPIRGTAITWPGMSTNRPLSIAVRLERRAPGFTARSRN